MALDSFDAANDDLADQADPEAISNLYIRTMENFNQALLELDSDPQLSDSPVLEVAFEECTRLKVWGLQNRVTLPETNPGSVTAHLKEQPELQQLVFEVLHDANSTLSRIMQEVQGGGAGSHSETIKQDSDSDSSSSSVDSTSPSLIRDLKKVFENVAELYRLQELFRLPRMKGKYIHSSQAQLDLPYYQQDYQHVRQKLRDWNNNVARISDDQEGSENDESSLCFREPDECPGLSPDSLFQRQQVEESSEELTDKLCRRLAIANSKRRKQLRYWQSHPYLTTQQDTTDGVVQKNLAKRVNAMTITKEPISDHDAPCSEKLPTTVHSFSTAPRSAVMATERNQHRDDVARTTYQPSVVGADIRTTIRIPDISRIIASTEAMKCPYCQLPLNSEILSSRESWKRHVFRDLRPYVCTAGHCNDPEKQFATRYDWKYHEMQLHHRQWDCSECQEVFEDNDTFQTHLSHSHKPSWTKRQVSIFANMRERSKDDAVLSVCPLCSLSMQHIELLDHVAGHLEDISLFALPKIAWFGDDDEQSKSNEAHGESSDHSWDHETISWISDESSQITPHSLLRNLFLQAKRVDRVASSLEQWYDQLGEDSCLGPDRFVNDIRRSTHALRNIGDCIYFQGTSEVAYQYLNLILSSHSATLRDITSFLKDSQLNTDEEWIPIGPDQHLNLYSLFLRELQRCLSRSCFEESTRLGRLRNDLGDVLKEQGLELSPSFASQNWDFKCYNNAYHHGEGKVEAHWAEFLFKEDREDHGDPAIFEGFPVPNRDPSIAYCPFYKQGALPTPQGLVHQFLFNRDRISVNFIIARGAHSLVIRIVQEGLPAYSPVKTLSSLSVFRESVDTLLISEWDTIQDCQKEEWARLCFTTYEDLVVFCCLFAALKAEIPSVPAIKATTDFRIERERVVYQGDIMEGGRKCRMELVGDDETGTLRFNAFECNPEPQSSPLWIAFLPQRGPHTTATKKAPKERWIGPVSFYAFCDRPEDDDPKSNLFRTLKIKFFDHSRSAPFASLLASYQLLDQINGLPTTKLQLYAAKRQVTDPPGSADPWEFRGY